MSVKEEITRLVDIVHTLRSENGCPWDREQTHQSLKPFLLEESYEALDAIDQDDHGVLCDELGDVLLQVVLHAELATEKGKFTIEDVIRGIGDKMIRRHPHVFAESKVDNSDQVLVNWEQIKKKEKQGVDSQLSGIPLAMPALIKADKIQRKAARLGFDWDNIAGAWEKVHEEIEEIGEVIDSGGDKDKLREEVGDLLFSVVNIARKLEINAEDALQAGNAKFTKRFQYIEQALKKEGKDIREVPLSGLELLWEESKS